MNTRLSLLTVTIASIVAVGFILSRNSEAQVTPDGEVIAQLKKAGSDVTKPHAIDFFFYFPTRAAADRVAEKLLAFGLTAKVDHAAQGPKWVMQDAKLLLDENRGGLIPRGEPWLPTSDRWKQNRKCFWS